MKKSCVGKMAQKAMQAMGKVLSDVRVEDGVLVEYKGKQPDFVVPESAEAIGGGVFFYNGNHVKTVTIPNHVKRIDSTAFIACTSIESFIVSGEHPYFCTIDGALLTKDGSKLLKVPAAKTEYTVPDSVREFDDCAFSDCEQLRKVTIPAGITGLKSRAFFACSALEEVTVPEGVYHIGEHAFGQCHSLRKVVLPESLRDMDSQAFYDCPALTEIAIHENNPHFKSVDGVLMNRDGSCVKAVPAARHTYAVPEGVTEVGPYAFFCGELEAVSIPAGVRFIGGHAFHSCTKLQRVILPDGVESIGEEAFHNCRSLSEVRLPDSVAEIGKNAFYSSGIRQLNIPAALKVLPKRMCEHCVNLKKLDVPATVECIGESAFARCENLRTVVIAEGVKQIGNEAFSDCRHLHAVNIPRSVVLFGEQVFRDCCFAEISLYADSCAAQRLTAEKEHFLYKEQ
ncbi:MAG: leucine-rich repeat domain-containing protein [Oscillospiraceae bacterium]|nr:leucine-rich repeat domain-containing protein [Oscillospiraceae bacterium]